MKKIPKNLDDKDMLKGYAEEESLEDAFSRREAQEKAARAAVRQEQEDGLAMAGLTPALIEKLSKELLQLRLDQFSSGTKNFQWKIRRSKNAVEIIAD